jgi:signal transduction histidine kinase
MERWEELLEDLRYEFLMREEELELLLQIDKGILDNERPLNEIFDFIVGRTQQLLRSDRVIIFLRKGGSIEVAYSAGQPAESQSFSISERRFIVANATVNIPDVTASPYQQEFVPITGDDGRPLRSLLSTPIIAGGILTGVISAEAFEPNAFSQVHERILKAIAAQIAIALQRVQAFDRAKLFAEVDKLIFETPESHRVIPAALEKVIDALRVIEHVELSGAQIWFLRGEDELEVAHSTNPADTGLVVRTDQSICGRAVRERQTITIGDVSADPEYRRMLGSGIQSEIAIPLKLSNAKVIGVLNVESEQLDAFEGFSQVILETFASRVITLLAFAKLTSDLTESIEVRSANDLLVAVGDQANSMILRINNIVGNMRLRILELRDLDEAGALGDHPFFTESIGVLKGLADETLQMPEEVTRILDQDTVVANPNHVIRSTLAKLAIPGNISVDLRLDPDVPPLTLYSFDIVVENLLRNAIDAMPSGGVLSITTSLVYHAEIGSGYIELAVKDTGVGISSENRSRIFELDFSTKHSSRSTHGLGLWWIRNFVLRVNGDITVSSEPDVGSEFVVRIPLENVPGDYTQHQPMAGGNER